MKYHIGDVELFKAPTKSGNGTIVVYDSDHGIKFDVERIFFVTNVAAGSIRGNHAHLACHQILIAASGIINVICDDGREKRSFRLSDPSESLFIPCSIWASQEYLTANATLTVLANRVYEASDYIHDYQQFLGFRGLK